MRVRGMNTGAVKTDLTHGLKRAAVNQEFTDKQKAFAVMKKIKPQFPNDSGGKLCLAIIEQALKDLVASYATASGRYRAQLLVNKRSASRYLQGELRLVSMAGVNPAWVRRVIKSSGLVIDEELKTAS